MAIKKLSANDLHKILSPSIFGVKNTKELANSNKHQLVFIPQPRAMKALEMGVSIENHGYHVFAMGEKGIGKKPMIVSFLKEKAKNKKVPNDHCYVYNFTHPDKPRALSFNPGEVKLFKKSMEKMVEDLRILIPYTFEGESYKQKVSNISKTFLEKQQKNITKLQQEATSFNLRILKEDNKFVIIATNDKKEPITAESLEKLSDAQKDTLNKNVKQIQQKLEKIVSAVPNYEKEKAIQISKLNKKILLKTIAPHIRKVAKKWVDHKEVLLHLEGLSEYILENAEQFIDDEETTKVTIFGKIEIDPYDKFGVNIMVDNSQNLKNNSAPVVVLENPTPIGLLGMIDVKTQLGMISTGYDHIHAGALHAANGGYLVIDVRKLLEYPGFWRIFKNILRSQKIEFLNFSEEFMSESAIITPESIPLNIKVILIGEEQYYYQLWRYDTDFRELFKIVADFDSEVPYTEENAKLVAEIISNIVKEEKLLEMDNAALAKIVAIAGHIGGSQEYLSTNIAKTMDIVRESNYIAKQKKSITVNEDHLVEAFALQKHRYGKFHEFLGKHIKNKVIVIQNKGTEVGQINGLSVVSINDVMFGQPQRITCLVYKGKTGLIDIERSVKLSGKIHSKGILILQSFLLSRFGEEHPISFSATLAFEQSYGKIDGDSATCAELYCLLSALTQTPIKQSIAVTGSMDQKGRVQAIGGVNAKIEGFFNVCEEDGLDGTQGVIIPASNVKDLMLPTKIRNAVEKGLFSIYAIEDISEGFEILSGVKMNDKGKDSLNEIIKNKWGLKV
jgi:lon-related putative ATP-dependent protease